MTIRQHKKPVRPMEGTYAAALIAILKLGYVLEIRPAPAGELEEGYEAAILLLQAAGWHIKKVALKDRVGRVCAYVYDLDDMNSKPGWAHIEVPIIRIDSRRWFTAVPID